MNKEVTLVTGGDGFIGRHLVSALLSRGNFVRCLVRKKTEFSKKHSDLEIVCGDLRDAESLKKNVQNVTKVYHTAAQVGPAKLWYKRDKLRDDYLEINVLGTLNLLKACENSRIKKFIYYSSISAAGLGDNLDEQSLCNPITDYGKSKLLTENLLVNFYKKNNFPVIIIRPAQVFGPHNVRMLTVFKLIQKGIMPTLGCGDNRISFCYIDSLVNNSLLVEEKGSCGETYFFSDYEYTVKDAAIIIAEIMKVHPPRIYLPKSGMYPAAFLKRIFEKIFFVSIYPFHIDFSKPALLTASSSWTCSNKTACELGYFTEIEFREAMRRTISWYQANKLL
ncbi:MAG: NAD(P)-dependent oxidoreductase [Candidatus Omnitrophica bacterium]|nr:NAD(P)-dependent oxidoreductase [Candidatus Omnitrophota bacterium]MBU1924639.1 NAD(P)-dependent oxidoreductase [Candidatus Omnitrophota bacterium]